MVQFPGNYVEAIVRLSPRSRSHNRVEWFPRDVRDYDALIYSQEPIPGLGPPDNVQRSTPPELASLPLVGAEVVTIRWLRYQEYLSWFVEGEKGRHEMGRRLLDTCSDGLRRLFESPPATPRPLRIWWSTETPELEDMPWELLAYTSRLFREPSFAFVRGVPEDAPVPKVQIGAPLRLALIGSDEHTLLQLSEALSALTQALKPMVLPGRPRDALRQVCRENYELVHFVANGNVSLAYEGVLWFGGKEPVPLSPGELSDACRGTRITVIGLTPESYDHASPEPPAVYRAFACLAAAQLPLPTIVAPLGPIERPDALSYWQTFYRALAETLDFGIATTQARQATAPLPVAAYPRGAATRLFQRTERRRAALESAGPDAQTLAAQIDFSDALLSQLQKIQQTSGPLPDSVEAFVKSADERRTRLRGELTRLRDVPEELP